MTDVTDRPYTPGDEDGDDSQADHRADPANADATLPDAGDADENTPPLDAA